MKLSSSLAFLALVSAAHGFSVAPVTTRTSQVARNMFGGAGEGAAMEDDPEEQAKIEQAAKAMGMSVQEYQLGLKARMKLTEELNNARLVAGDDRVQVTRDGNNPPKFLEVAVTEDGKAMGAEAVSKELCAAFKKSSDDSRVKRSEAQKSMMAYIGEEMKLSGMDKDATL